MASVNIRFSTDILSRLGEELNPNADQGILELVKNAYDADALQCKIELIDSDRPGGSIRLTDNGVGMDPESIVDGWLVLGSSRKRKENRTKLGRIPAGSKGLGRLSALRLGQSVSLRTRPYSDRSHQYELKIEWDKYTEASVVEEVPLQIKRMLNVNKSPAGTEILIEGLKSRVPKMDIKRLARALILLADPFGDDPSSFSPILVAPEYSDLEALVNRKYFTDADYHLTATLDASGRAKANVSDWKGQVLFEADHKELTVNRENRLYSCPKAQFDLWAFLLTQTAFVGRSSTLGEVRNWLGTFGGVHLYENGLRVSPYGNAGNDWLDMNLRRVQSPEERPGTNTSIGRVSVTDVSGQLLQKTDRSGFIETDSFIELRSFAQDALEWMARRRLELAEERRATTRAEAPKRVSRSKANIEEAIEKAPKQIRESVKEAFQAYERSRDKEVHQLQREVQLYRTLSTAGITAATFAHESRGNPIKVISQSARAIERRASKALGKEYFKLLEKPVNGILSAVDSLAVLSSTTLSLVEYSKRRLGRVDVHEVIDNVLSTFDPFLKGRDVTVSVDLVGKSPFLRGSEAALESVITNLINNSLSAFEYAGTEKRKLLVRTKIEGNTMTLSVLDNGPGIEGINLKDIWLPGQTTQPNGTGLGLTIVRDTVRDLGGNVSAVEHGELGGAVIEVELPIIGA